MEKKPVHKVRMTEGKRNIIQQLLQEYDIESAEDIQDALKDLLGGTIKEMMEDIYGFEASEGFISDVTDKILPQITDWQKCIGKIDPTSEADFSEGKVLTTDHLMGCIQSFISTQFITQYGIMVSSKKSSQLPSLRRNINVASCIKSETL